MTTPEGNLAYLEGLLELAERAAPAVATGMARYISWRASEITLRTYLHAPGEWYGARAGEPPAYASGDLAESIYAVPAWRALRTSAMVTTKLEYSRILEFGCVVTPKARERLAWQDTGRPDNPGGVWKHMFVLVPEHPFLGPTTEDAINDGELQEIAIEIFREYDP